MTKAVHQADEIAGGRYPDPDDVRLEGNVLQGRKDTEDVASGRQQW